MAKIAGFRGVMEYSDDGGTTYTAIGELRDWTLRASSNPIDATTKDSGGWEETLHGIRNWTVSADGLFVDADAGQSALFDALVDQNEVTVRLRPAEGSGLPEYEGLVIVTDWELGSPLSDATVTSVEMKGNGALTESAQA